MKNFAPGSSDDSASSLRLNWTLGQQRHGRFYKFPCHVAPGALAQLRGKTIHLRAPIFLCCAPITQSIHQILHRRRGVEQQIGERRWVALGDSSRTGYECWDSTTDRFVGAEAIAFIKRRLN